MCQSHFTGLNICVCVCSMLQPNSAMLKPNLFVLYLAACELFSCDFFSWYQNFKLWYCNSLYDFQECLFSLWNEGSVWWTRRTAVQQVHLTPPRDATGSNTIVRMWRHILAKPLHIPSLLWKPLKSQKTDSSCYNREYKEYTWPPLG